MSTARHLEAALLAAAVIGTFLPGAAHAQTQIPATATETGTMAQDEADIRGTLAAYNAALNGGDTAAVLPLYDPDGICMAPFSLSHIGQAALKQAYDGFFKALRFDVKFDVAEVVITAPTWAFVRTNSAGTTLHHATGTSVAEANQELFVMHKGDDGRWRIARYSFSPTNPPAP
jgi:uncharacterized protein (TIGR02246 family)